VAAVVVVVSLIYLAVQIRQNTRIVQASSHQGVVKWIQDFDLLLANDPEVIRIWAIGRRHPDRLDNAEQARFRALLDAFYRGFESVYYQAQNKLIDERVYHSMAAISIRISAQPGVLQWWQSYGDLMSDQFRRFIERERAALRSTRGGLHSSG
jgi:hypothetical protein